MLKKKSQCVQSMFSVGTYLRWRIPHFNKEDSLRKSAAHRAMQLAIERSNSENTGGGTNIYSEKTQIDL